MVCVCVCTCVCVSFVCVRLHESVSCVCLCDLVYETKRNSASFSRSGEVLTTPVTRRVCVCVCVCVCVIQQCSIALTRVWRDLKKNYVFFFRHTHKINVGEYDFSSPAPSILFKCNISFEWKSKYTAGTESIQTPLKCSLIVSLQPFAKIKKVHFISH